MNSLIEDCSDPCFLCVVPVPSYDVDNLRHAVRSRYVFENSETESDDDSKAAKKVKIDRISSVDTVLHKEGVAPEEIVVESDQIDGPTDEEGAKKDGDAAYDDDTWEHDGNMMGTTAMEFGRATLSQTEDLGSNPTGATFRRFLKCCNRDGSGVGMLWRKHVQVSIS